MSERHRGRLGDRLDRSSGTEVEPARVVHRRGAADERAPEGTCVQVRPRLRHSAAPEATTAAAALVPLTVPEGGLTIGVAAWGASPGAPRPVPRPPASCLRRTPARARRRGRTARRTGSRARGARRSRSSPGRRRGNRSASVAAPAGMLTTGHADPFVRTERPPAGIRASCRTTAAAPARRLLRPRSSRVRPRRRERGPSGYAAVAVPVEEVGDREQRTLAEHRRQELDTGRGEIERQGLARRTALRAAPHRRRRPGGRADRHADVLRRPPVVGRAHRERLTCAAGAGDAAVAGTRRPVVPGRCTTSVSSASAPATALAAGLSLERRVGLGHADDRYPGGVERVSSPFGSTARSRPAISWSVRE